MSWSLPPGSDVSVVIPFYRAESTLYRALTSVAAQTRPVREIVVVDDASGPEAGKALAGIVAMLPQLQLKTVTLPVNVGAAAARNAGWAVAEGNFIAFLDADDAWHPRKVEIQSDYLMRYPEVDACGHQHRIALPHEFGANATALPADMHTQLECPGADIGRFSILLRNPFVTPSVMLRSRVLLRFDPGQRHMEDHRLWMRMVLSGLRVRKLELPLVTLFKPVVGTAGLSGDVCRMQAADIENYRALRQAGFLGRLETWAWLGWARLKHLRRDALLRIDRGTALSRTGAPKE